MLLDLILEPLELLTRPDLYNSQLNKNQIDEFKELSIDVNFETNNQNIQEEYSEEFSESYETENYSEKSFTDKSSEKSNSEEFENSRNYERNFMKKEKDLAFESFLNAEDLNKLVAEIFDLFQEIPKNEEYSSDIDDRICIDCLEKHEKKNELDNEDHSFSEENPEDSKNYTNMMVFKEKIMNDTNLKSSFLNIKENFDEKKENFEITDKDIEKIEESRMEIDSFDIKKNLFSSVEEEDSFLEVLIKSFYLPEPINSNVLALLLLNLSENLQIWSKILNGLVAFLFNCSSFNKILKISNIFNTSSNICSRYSIFSYRIIEILNQMAALSPKVSLELITPPSFKLRIINSLNPLNLSGFELLLTLFQEPLYTKSNLHLVSLLSLTSNIIDKLGLKVPKLSENSLNTICGLLRLENLTDNCVEKLITIITNLYKISSCRNILKTSLNASMVFIAYEVQELLSKYEVSKHGVKELQLLRIIKIIKSVYNTFDSIDFL